MIIYMIIYIYHIHIHYICSHDTFLQDVKDDDDGTPTAPTSGASERPWRNMAQSK